MSTLRAVVTAGGTFEAIDDVRISALRSFVSEGESKGAVNEELLTLVLNISKGKFGIEIARLLAEHGVETTLVCAKDSLSLVPKDAPFAVQSFRSFADLYALMEKLTKELNPEILVMSAAVSDYSPISVEGKISSNQDRLVVEFRKNPKILSKLREWAGARATIVGFKLLSGVSKETLIEVARHQAEKAVTTFTVANDMKEIDFERGFHPVWLVTADGKAERVEDFRGIVARKIVERVIRETERVG